MPFHIPSIKRISLLHFLLALFLFQCGEKREVNTTAISQEVKKRKITRISPSDFLVIAENMGKNTVNSIEKNWKEALNNGLENRGIEFSKKFCIVPFIPGFDTISRFATSIRKVGAIPVKQGRQDSLETMVQDAYNYNLENKIKPQANIQRDGEKYILYTSPIFFDDEMCLNCHVKRSNDSLIRKDDYAGFWSIKTSKKQLLEKHSLQ